MDETRKDNLACGAVLATMLVTIACGAFVVHASPDSPRYAQATLETSHD
jgi:hypothetical protein